MITSPGVVGLTRSEQSAANQRNLLDAAATAGNQFQQVNILNEQKRQYNITEGMTRVLNGQDIGIILGNDEGKAAMAPFLGALTGLSGKALSDYMDAIAASPADFKTLMARVQAGEALGYADLTSIGSPESEQAYLARTVNYQKEQAPAAQGTVPVTSAAAPAPTPASGGGLNADELQALSGYAGTQVIQIQGMNSDGTPIPYTGEPGGVDIRSTGFASPLIPGQVFQTAEEAGKAVTSQVMQILSTGSPQAKQLWTEISGGASRQAMARSPEGSRVLRTGELGDPSAPRYGPATGRPYEQVFAPEAPTSGPTQPAAPMASGAPAPSAAPQLSPSMNFRQFLIAAQAAGALPGTDPVNPAGDDGTSLITGNPESYKEFRRLQSGGQPSWATKVSTGAPVASGTGAATTGTGAPLSQDKELVKRYAMSTYQPESYSGAPLTDAEKVEAKRIIAKDMAASTAATRKEWRATPGLRGASAAYGERIADILQRIAPGVRAEDHPLLAETRVNWADLTVRKTEVEIRKLAADAGLTEVETQYYWDKIKSDAAIEGMKALAASSDSYAKLLSEARQGMQSFMGEDMKVLATIKDPVLRETAEARILDSPLIKPFWTATLDGLAVLSGRALTKEDIALAKRGFLGIGYASEGSVGVTGLGGRILADGSVEGSGQAAASATGDPGAVAAAQGYVY